MPDNSGYVYLLHFSEPIAHAKHYIGFAEDLQARLDKHGTSRGAAIMRAARQRGITWCVAKVWIGVDRHFERRLKNRKEGPRLCPCCRGEIDNFIAVEMSEC